MDDEKEKGNPKSFSLPLARRTSAPPEPQNQFHVEARRMIFASVSCSWQLISLDATLARVLHHFIPTNEASNEKYFFVYLPSRLRWLKE
jgi:hypothetical protein